jgi:hypothetical protein
VATRRRGLSVSGERVDQKFERSRLRCGQLGPGASVRQGHGNRVDNTGCHWVAILVETEHDLAQLESDLIVRRTVTLFCDYGGGDPRGLGPVDLDLRVDAASEQRVAAAPLRRLFPDVMDRGNVALQLIAQPVHRPHEGAHALGAFSLPPRMIVIEVFARGCQPRWHPVPSTVDTP